MRVGWTAIKLRADDVANGSATRWTSGDNPRPLLVVAADTIPCADEEYIRAGLTLNDLADNVELRDEDWRVGNNRTSHCSPWVPATVKRDAVAGPQGSLTDTFVGDIVERSVRYRSGDVDGPGALSS